MAEEEGKSSELNPQREILRRVREENKNSLHIARVPLPTKVAFIELADREFCGDYGMTIKWLIDDILSQDIRMIMARLENHERRIIQLEETLPQESAQLVEEQKGGQGELIAKTMSGREIRRRKKVNDSGTDKSS